MPLRDMSAESPEIIDRHQTPVILEVKRDPKRPACVEKRPQIG
jgi:hypothetical protein